MTDTQNPIVSPPATLNTTVIDPQTKQQTYAFPLQTAAWLKLQNTMKNALTFPTSTDDFTKLYGSFSDEGSVNQAVNVLGRLKATADEYGDPSKLISQLTSFAQANTPPDSVYGHGVWLASQTIVTAQQISSLLKEGLTDIGQETDPKQRLSDLTDLLTGEGGISTYANTLQGQITTFQTKTSGFYSTLNDEISGPTDSLKTYLDQSSNVLKDAQKLYDADVSQIDSLNSNIDQLNKEYIGFTVAASVAPLFLVIPVFGVILAAADATTFGILATKVKNQMDELRKQRDGVEADEAQKLLLKTQLTTFNTQTQDISNDGTDFLTQIGVLAAGWGEFQTQIATRLADLTADDLKDWSKFLQKINFQAALDGWGLIGTKAESFYQAGFVRFADSTATST